MPRSGSIARRLLPVVVLTVASASASAHTEISAEQAHAMIAAQTDLVVLDVREEGEFCGSNQHVENAANLPWISEVLQSRFAEIPTDLDIIVVCASGARSHMAATFLDGEGFTRIFDMQGGMSAWDWDTEPCGEEPLLELDKDASGAELDWTPVTGQQDYDLLRGEVGNLADATTHIDLGPTVCLADNSPFTYFTDATFPFGTVFYLTRHAKAETWGASSSGLSRSTGSASCE